MNARPYPPREKGSIKPPFGLILPFFVDLGARGCGKRLPISNGSIIHQIFQIVKNSGAQTHLISGGIVRGHSLNSSYQFGQVITSAGKETLCKYEFSVNRTENDL